MHSIEVISLSREFKRDDGKLVKALDGVDLTVRRGEIFGLLGPNGAGKTTLIRILATLLLPTSGSAFVEGYDVVKEDAKVREIINVVSGGERAGYGITTVRENLWYFTQLYGYGWRDGWRRVDELVELLEIEEYANVRLNKLSTGMIQKYNLARGLVNDPRILFLDEPTLGLDVEAARYIRALIKKLVKERPDRTIFLTTHYMAEAEELCDRIAIIHEGRVVAIGTSEQLKKLVSKDVVYKIDVKGLHEKLAGVVKEKGLAKVATCTSDIAAGITALRVVLDDEDEISKVVNFLSKAGYAILSVSRVEPTLEDVFLKLVGARLGG